MKADQVGARLGKGSRQRIHRLHHQVHINGHWLAAGRDAVRAQRLAHHRAECEVGHIVLVHHVKVDPVGTGINHGTHLLAKAGKVRREDGGRNQAGRQ